MSGWRPPINHKSALSVAVRQSSRTRSFSWCRRPNGFSDNPKWRAVSAYSGLALSTVVAFVNRLEELGNDSANRGDIRGSVVGFKTQDFAAALDISAEDANKLFSSLEHPDIGWIADGMIADFHDRNPDAEDPTANERQRRRRSRDKILRKLGDLARLGLMSGADRTEVENELLRLDHKQLVDLQVELEMKSLQPSVTRDLRTSQRDSVTPSANQIEAPSTPITGDKDVTRDNVTVTPDQNRICKEAESPSTSTADVVESAGSAKEERKIVAVLERDRATWLKREGAQLIMNRMGETYEGAMARLSRWSEQLADCAVLADILQGAEDRVGHSFHMEVTDQIRRSAH
jgi:hypothetical protein